MSVSQIFIVHGHDESSLDSVTHFLRRIDMNPIVLRELPDGGRTIIEKFENSIDIDFVIVLLTPDDEGKKKKGGTLKGRARQNVVLEFGYFIGRLSRKKVAALKKTNVEIPSDLSGLLYINFDRAGKWKNRLAIEMEHAGLTIDWHKVGLT